MWLDNYRPYIGWEDEGGGGSIRGKITICAVYINERVVAPSISEICACISELAVIIRPSNGPLVGEYR